MRFAAFETSGDWCSVALWLDGEAVSLERRVPNRHSEAALPMLESLLDKAKLRLPGIQAVAFGAGPGSFTGLRIACGLAQGIALARGLPVLGVSTLEALAEECGAARVAACIDARMNEVYYAALEKRAGAWHEAVPARCVPPHDVRPPGEGWIGAGSGFAAYGGMGLDTVYPEVHATALAVATLAAPRLERGEGVDAALAVPLYVRDKIALTQAELERR